MSKDKVENNTNSLLEGISVIIPTYKGEKWILTCLNSLASQSLDNELFEIIVIINGEKDNTENLIKSYKKQHTNINVKKIVLDESGAAFARNKGIKKASCQYITFIDDDDWVSQSYLESLYESAEKDTVVIAQITDVEPNGNFNENNYINNEIKKIYHSSKPIKYYDLKYTLAINAIKLIPTNILKNQQFDINLKSGEDVVLFTTIAINYPLKYKIIDPNKKAIYYRLIRDSSVSRKSYSYSFGVEERFAVIDKLNNLLLNVKDESRKKFIMNKIDAQASFTKDYLDETLDIEIEKIQKLIETLKINYYPENVLVPYKEQVLKLRQLNEAVNLKYKESSVQIKQLNQKLNESNQKLNESNQKLNESNQKYRIATQQAKDFKTRYLNVLNSKAYQLGLALISSKKSFKSMAKLPKKIWDIKKGSTTKTSQAVAINNQIKPKKRLPKFNKTFNIEKPLKDLNIACIMDTFTYNSYKYEANFHQLTPQKWEEEIKSSSPDFLFIESAWRGKDELWWNTIPKKCKELVDIVKYCNNKNIPTVFWNKEDPVHFNSFIKTAELFDFVFTTDIDLIDSYKKALGHDRVYMLTFACQPKVNNPIEKYKREDKFCFAGAYYTRYPERTKDLDEFVQYIPQIKPIEIYDRMYGKDDPNYMFPSQYKPYIVGTLPFDEIDKAYKGYNFAINLNSVKQSQSMFARRVFEVLASNTITLSNFSKAVRLLFGNLVITTDNGPEMVKRVKSLLEDKVMLKKHKLLGLRKVLTEHTYQTRLDYVASKVYNNKQAEDSLPQITMFSLIDSEEAYEQVLKNYDRQTYHHKNLLIITNKVNIKNIRSDIAYIDFEKSSDKTIDNLYSADYIAKIDPEDYYGTHYLTDMALATLYFDGAVIGKEAFYQLKNNDLIVHNSDKEYHTVDSLLSSSCIIQGNLLNSITLEQIIAIDSSSHFVNIECLSIDTFNYCKNGKELTDLQKKELEVTQGLLDGLSVKELIAHAEKKVDDIPIMVGQAEHLLLTNIYPSYDDLYRNGFVHARVKAYQDQGIKVDIFKLQGQDPSYDEFENVDVASGSTEVLKALLEQNQYKSILVHFLDEKMWDVLKNFIDNTKVYVWVHGAEIQPWHRREFNYTNKTELEKAKVISAKRTKFWKSILTKPHKNLKLIFVSNYFAEEVQEDLELTILEQNKTIIHNVINTDLFNYIPKNIEQRKKVLSIRPYASRKYANDLSVKAIQELSKKPYFHELEFRMIGDGVLFDETLAPIKDYPNVHIERRFLSQSEIAALHKEYGSFLTPTRMDAQGVSRDEAMSSGLVPLTNGVTAIPEFVDETCGILAGDDDALGLAEGIAKIYENPDLFQSMSEAAAKRVRNQCDFEHTISKEIELLNKATEQTMQKESKDKKKILIFGSCVSRDILNSQNNFQLVDYFARSSFASIFQPLFPHYAIAEELESKFQQKIVKADMQKNLVSMLKNGEFNILLLDFIDERFNLFEYKDSICTLSNEAISLDIQKKYPNHKIIKSGSEEFIKKWEEGWKKFIGLMHESGLLEKVILNKVYWSETTLSGDNFMPTYPKRKIRAMNITLDKLYAIAEASLPPQNIMQFSDDLMVGADEHRWGKSPFHYVAEYYEFALNFLSNYSRS